MDDDVVDVHAAESDALPDSAYSLSGTVTHLFVPIPRYIVPQTLAYSFLHMDWMAHVTKVCSRHSSRDFNHYMAMYVS